MHTHRQVFAVRGRGRETEARGGDGSRHRAGVCLLQHSLGNSGVHAARVELCGQIHRERQTEAQGQTTERPQTNGNKKEVALQALPTLGSAFL